jgi:hypothetical protein
MPTGGVLPRCPGRVAAAVEPSAERGDEPLPLSQPCPGAGGAVLQQDQLPFGSEHPVDLTQRLALIADGAQHEAAYNGVYGGRRQGDLSARACSTRASRRRATCRSRLLAERDCGSSSTTRAEFGRWIRLAPSPVPTSSTSPASVGRTSAASRHAGSRHRVRDRRPRPGRRPLPRQVMDES